MRETKSVMTTRREFLAFVGAFSLSGYRVPGQAGTPGSKPQPDQPMSDLSSDVMDDALERLAPYGPSFRGGLSNHGPMTAEALVSLGHNDMVIDWVEGYRKRLEPRTEATEPIAPGEWKKALGDRSRLGDWHALFAGQMAESPWRDVLGVWVPRLAPGIVAAGLHSVIRVGHAACSLAVRENALRLDELSQALAYWAAEYLALPGEYSGAGKLAPSIALSKVQKLPAEFRKSGGLITTQMKDLVGFAPFAEVIHLVDPSAGTPNFLCDLVGTFAGTLVNTNRSSFDFLHAVTGASAITELLPYVKEDERDEVLAYTWQVTAGIFARYAGENLVAEVEVGPQKEDFKQLARLAVATGDEHTIKLTAACAREWIRNPDPRLMAAASKRVHRGR